MDTILTSGKSSKYYVTFGSEGSFCTQKTTVNEVKIFIWISFYFWAVFKAEFSCLESSADFTNSLLHLYPNIQKPTINNHTNHQSLHSNLHHVRTNLPIFLQYNKFQYNKRYQKKLIFIQLAIVFLGRRIRIRKPPKEASLFGVHCFFHVWNWNNLCLQSLKLVCLILSYD